MAVPLLSALAGDPPRLRDDAPVPPAVVRLRQAAVCLLLVVTAFHQSPGLVGNDTKLDLTADPGRFLGRALDLWNPSSAFGQLQNQAYGYLFPMGPFHLAGAWLGVPAWVVQRAWMALLLVTAFLGVLRLAARLDLGSPGTRMLGGLAYALSPRILTEVGGNSSEILPMALLPWVLVPLVGPHAERDRRQAAMRSGVAVLCMGAVNAAAVLAVLVLPAIWLLPGLRRAAGRRLAAWWCLAVVLACSWWFVPLLLQGRYAPNFLDVIETAATTTSTTSLSEVLRGTSHWLAYVAPAGLPWWPAGWTLVSNGAVVLNTALLAGLAVLGLLRGRVPGRGRWLAAAALGLLAMSAAHAGPWSGPFVHELRQLLDGSLAPFRNVHKLDPLVRLPLALGVCGLLSALAAGRSRRAGSAAVCIILLGVAAPALAGQVVPAGGYERLPSWWRDTGAWLDDHAAGGRTLVVPARGFGEYLWGRPLDDPLQALTRQPWAVRDAVPLGGAGTTRLLDAIGARLDTGRPSPALAEVLARSGVRYLVVSNDLDRRRTSAPRPVLVHQALDGSPGLRLVAGFGPQVGDPAGLRAAVADRGLDVRYPAVEVYEVMAPAPVASVLPRAGTWLVSGGPESLFQLGDRGLLAGRATVLAGDGSPGPAARTALTDALRRREVAFGSVRDNASATLAADEPLRRAQPVPDLLPVPGEQHLATSLLLGARAVSASSSAADAGAVLGRSPARRPASAFDGDPDTAWVSGSLSGAEGQWVQLDPTTAVDPAGTTIALLHDRVVRAQVRQVRVTTDRGQATTRLRDDDSVQRLAVPPGSTRHLRVTVERVRGDGFGTLVGIREVSVPGVTVQETVVLPRDQPVLSGQPVVLLDRAVGARDGCVTDGERSVCAPELVRAGEDQVRLDRTFALPAPAVLALGGSARPVPGPALDALLDAWSGVRAGATSRLVPDPAQRPATVLDGDAATGWVAAPGDRRPALVLTWDRPRRVAGLRIETDEGLPAARPQAVDVVTPAGVVRRTVRGDGVLTFPAVSTDRLELRFVKVERRVSQQPDGQLVPLPVGVSEVVVPGLAAVVGQPPAGAEPVTLPCGSAPPVLVDGVLHRTAATGTRDDLLHLRPVRLSSCDGGGAVALGAGSHRVVGAAAGPLQVEGLTLGSPASLPPDASRTTRVERWDAEHRVLDVGAGAESYLVVHENSNAGWHAALDGRPLAAARVDGWQQAWVVPAGSGGRVVLEFRPGRLFHAALAVGGVLALLLLVLAVRPRRRAGVPAARPEVLAGRPVRGRAAGRAAVRLLALGTLVALGGAAGAGLYAGLEVATALSSRWVGRERTRQALPLVAAAAVVLAGLVTALAPWGGSRSPGAFGAPAQLLALLAVAAAAVSLTSRPSSTAASGPEPDAPPPAG